MSPDVILAAEAASKRYGDRVALDRVSIAVLRGECVALIGESGAGKSTLLRCFNRLVTLDSGRVLIEERDGATLDAIVLRREMGYVPQEGGLLPHWRVGRNVALVPWLKRDPARAVRTTEALQLVGLDPGQFAMRWPRELSGGQRQRVAIARALASRPAIVLFDEPFGALDAITRAELQTAFSGLRRELGFTSLLVTHDLREALDLADRVVVMRRGQIEQIAAPSELLAAPATDYVAELLARARVRA